MNTCGECNACCHSLGFTDESDYNKEDATIVASQDQITALNLIYPYGGSCNLLSSCGACSVYDNRPNVCREYECGYIDYDLPIEFRPDNIGVISKVIDNRVEFEMNSDFDYVPDSAMKKIRDALELKLKRKLPVMYPIWKDPNIRPPK